MHHSKFWILISTFSYISHGFQSLVGDFEESKPLEQLLNSVSFLDNIGPDVNSSSSFRVKREIDSNERQLQYLKQIFDHNLVKNVLLNQVASDLVKLNMKNSMAFIRKLSSNQLRIDDHRTSEYSLAPKQVKQCHSGNPCDVNAICVEALDSIKCQCRKGFIGNGMKGNCFNGAFCSGKYCRLNGACSYKTNFRGYRCQCMLTCHNGGKCLMRPHKYECQCASGFIGPLCSQSVESFLAAQKTLKHLKDRVKLDTRYLSDLISLVQPSDASAPMISKNQAMFNQTDEFLILNLVKEYLDKHRNDLEASRDNELKKMIFSYSEDNSRSRYSPSRIIFHHFFRR